MSYWCWCSSLEQPSFIKFLFVKKGKKIGSLSSNLSGLPGVGKGITKYMGSPLPIPSEDEGVEGVYVSKN